MTNFAEFHAGTQPSGRVAWINEVAYAWPNVPRGHVAVLDDGTTRYYRVPRRERRAFRRWAEAVFSGMNCNRVRGAWPRYRVEAV